MESIDRFLEHRRSFRLEGVQMTGPLLRITDLNSAERAVIESELSSWILLAGSSDPKLCAWVLHSNGVMCPHPTTSRLYDGFYRTLEEVSFDESEWYSCGVCDSIVINRNR